MQTLKLNNDIILKYDILERDLQELVDTIISTASMLGYLVRIGEERRGPSITIIINQFNFNIEFAVSDFDREIYQVYIGDRVDYGYNNDFRIWRHRHFGVMNACDKNFHVPLENFIQMLANFEPEKIYKEIKKN